jgi:hypothetical protein
LELSIGTKKSKIFFGANSNFKNKNYNFYIMKDDEMNKLIKSKNWKKLEDNFVFVANHEESIKTKNIVEKIKFEGNKKRYKIYNWFNKFI